jgi:putative cell wall-binding protein
MSKRSTPITNETRILKKARIQCELANKRYEEANQRYEEIKAMVEERKRSKDSPYYGRPH